MLIIDEEISDEEEGINDEDSPDFFSSNEKELVESIEKRDFERLAEIEDEQEGFSEETAKRIFRLFKATEITRLDEVISLAWPFAYQKEISFELCVYNNFFTISKAILDNIKDFVSTTPPTEAFRRGINPGEKINVGKYAKTERHGSTQVACAQVLFSGIVLEVLKDVVNLYVNAPLESLAIFAEDEKKPLLWTKNCGDISMQLGRKCYLFIVDDKLYKVSLLSN